MMMNGDMALVAEVAPVNAVMGAILSQEVVKVVTKRDLPICNILTFNGHTLEARIVELK